VNTQLRCNERPANERTQQTDSGTASEPLLQKGSKRTLSVPKLKCVLQLWQKRSGTRCTVSITVTCSATDNAQQQWLSWLSWFPAVSEACVRILAVPRSRSARAP
jgi:hypothetical protein